MSAPMCKILIWTFLFTPVTTAIDEAPCQEALGMVNGKIREEQLMASSGNADQARLYGDRAWRARTDASMTSEWIEVDFQQLVNVTAMAIQGNPQGSQNEYVMKYKVAYSVNKSRDGWLYITNQTKNDEVFDGNTNRFTPVFQAFQKPLHLRYIKIDTIGCYERCVLRTEFYGCNAFLCQEPLGMSNAIVREDQISASSIFDDGSRNRARLFGDRSWRAINRSSEWIHVDFQHFVNITALAMQGNPAQNEFVTKFKVAFSVYDTGDTWAYVEDDGNNVKEYIGNNNQYTPAFHVFSRPIYLRYIRIDAIQCENRCALRLEFYGCEAAEHKVPHLDALGMANGLITEHQLSASSARSLDPANQARLYGDRAWRENPRKNTASNEWIEVDFQNVVTVTAMAIQGRPNGNEYVIKYKVAYRVNKTQGVWMNVTDEYGNEKEFDGNNDSYTPVFQVFPNPLHLRYIRITALECENECGLRLEFYASNDQPTTSTESSTLNPSKASITSIVGTSAASAQPASLTGSVAGSIIGVLVIIAIATAAVIYFFLRRRNKSIATSKQGNQFDGPYDLTVTGEILPTSTQQAAAFESISNKQHDSADTADNTEEEYQDIHNDENDYAYTDIQGKSKNEENPKELVNIYAKSQYGGRPPSHNVSNEGPRDNKSHQSGVREQNTEDVNSDNIYQDLLDENKDNNEYAYTVDGPSDLNISDEVAATAKQQDSTDTVNNTEEDYQDIHEDSNEYGYAYAADVKEEREDEGWVDNTVYATSNDEKGKQNQAETELAETEEGWEDNSLYAITSNDDQADHNNTHNSQDEGWEDNAIYAS